MTLQCGVNALTTEQEPARAESLTCLQFFLGHFFSPFLAAKICLCLVSFVAVGLFCCCYFYCDATFSIRSLGTGNMTYFVPHPTLLSTESNQFCHLKKLSYCVLNSACKILFLKQQYYLNKNLN